MAKEKKKPDTPPGQGGTPPGQSGKPPKPVQYDVRAAVSAVGVAAVDMQLTLAPPVEPPPEGTRYDVIGAATASGRVRSTTRVMPASSTPPATVPDTGDPVVNGANLQAAITAATIGNTISVQAGAVYARAGGYTFPATPGDGIVLQTETLDEP